MTLSRALLLTFCLVVTACQSTAPAPERGTHGGGAATETPSASPNPQASSGLFLPDPEAPIPVGPIALAGALKRVTDALRDSIDEWVSDGDPSTWPPPKPVVLQALFQQRVYRTLASAPRLASRVIANLPVDLAREAQADVTAGADLHSLVGPVTHPVRFRTQNPLPADVLLAYYREAERRFGVAWQVLAAVNYVETKFGRVTSASSAGAEGPMQFLLSTWETYGMGGDIHDPRDAILGAANYLHESGAPQDYSRALYEYNPAWAYVHAVLLYAREMTRDSRNFYAYYNWQVFVLTPSGERRLTGPGL